MKFSIHLIGLLLPAILVGCLAGARCVAAPEAVNLLQSADDFTSASWSSFSLKTTVTKDAALSPDNTQDATHLVVGGFIGQVISAAIPGHTYVFSSWMKSATGTDQSIQLCGENNPPAAGAKSIAYTVTPKWQRFFIVYKCPDGGNSNFRFSYRAGDMYVWHPVVEDVTGNASQVPSDVPGVSASPTGETAQPAPASPTQAAGSKNLLKSSDDFSSSAWSSFSSKTTITTAAGQAPDKTNTAAHLVVGAFVGQVIDNAVPGHTYVFSTWMKSATGAEQNVQLAGENNPPAPDSKFAAFTVTSDWQRFFIVFKCPDGGKSNFRFSYRTGDIYAWHPQVEDVTGNAAQTPTDYAERLRPAPLKPLVVKGPPASGVIQNISCWGDSLTAGAGGTPYPADLQSDPSVGQRKVANGGVGGQTSTQIKERFLAAPEKFGDLVVLWAGRNNYGDRETVEADIAEMVDKLSTDRFVVLSVLNMTTEPKGGPALAAIDTLNHDLANRYKGHFLDVRSALVEAYDKSNPQDVADHDADVTPTSLRSDKIHLNTAGYRFVAERVLSYLKTNQWL
ncbi:MAG: GDSL-type esterase/lipase family protein [Capsulimonadaceae bacterium]|nr:GDSL-type esterase/lipase family protein [Capsulimonadaceae bacterium]